MSIIQGHAKSSGVTGFYPKTIDQSLRFEDGDSAYLSRTPASAGNRKTFTWSGWVKRGNLGSYQAFFSAANSDASNPRSSWQFRDNDTLYIGFNPDGGTWRELITTAVYRDTSAWYHIVVAVDTTQATASDRVKLYVNGEQVTDFSTEGYPPQNTDLTINNTIAHSIGRYQAGTSSYVDMYMAEVHFTDGTAYTADDFGELKSGIWVPKEVSVTYGTNGFYLDFADGAAIGDDESGNGNDWTANNLVASDVVLDSPTNNFAVISPLAIGPRNNGADSSGVLSEGNLKLVLNGSGDDFSGTMAVSSGKWYFEATLDSAPNHGCGWTDVENFTNGDYSASSGGIVNSDAFYGTEGSSVSNIVQDGSTSSATNSFSNGDIIGYALDIDAGTLDIYYNGGLDTQVTGIPQATYVSVFGDSSSADANFTANFGQDSTFAGNVTAGGNSDANGIGDFAYAPPSGFLALCTANLPDPVIDPAQDATPEDHFNVALWTGNGSTQSIDVGHATDFAWIKTRSASVDHRNYDSVRGVNTALRSNTTGAEAVETTSLTSFDSTGFSLGNYAGVNNSGSTYVGWSWKAGGTGVSNTDGSITSTVSANTDAGFSIVSFTANNTAGATFGHGLTQKPEMLIIKVINSSSGWPVYHSALGATQYLALHSTIAAGTDSTYWNNTDPDDSVVTLGTTVNYLTNDMICYAFHSVDGFSKVGSYIGNGSTDGTFVYTGFRPKFIMLKRANSTGGSWIMMDAEREPYNFVENYVLANSSAAEVTTTSASDCDFLSNGIKFRTNAASVNASGDEIIYIAFAESPFKYSNAR